MQLRAATPVWHTPDVLDSYFRNLDQVFGLIAECEKGVQSDAEVYLPRGFKRLN